MTAHEVPMVEFTLQRLLSDTYALNLRCAELIFPEAWGQMGASWNRDDETLQYMADEDEWQ